MRMKFNKDSLEHLLSDLGSLLKSRGERFEVVAIGGGSLLLLGLIDRPTRDIDLVGLIKDGVLRRAGPMPKALEDAIHELARLPATLTATG